MTHSSCLLLSEQIGDLTLGKPSLPWLPSSSTLRHALLAFHARPDISEISIWDCPNHLHTIATSAHLPSFPPSSSSSSCVCIGKISLLQILCFLASKHLLLRSPCKALLHPLSSLLAHQPPSLSVLHIDSHASLLEALNAIAKGVQNLVVPIDTKTCCESIPKNCTHAHNGREFCWLTHEDVLRFLIGSVALFNPIHKMSVRDLGIIQTEVFMMGVEERVSSCLEMIREASEEMEAVAVVERVEGGARLVGEISAAAVQGWKEAEAVAALETLNGAEMMEYVQGLGSVREGIMERMRVRVRSHSHSHSHCCWCCSTSSSSHESHSHGSYCCCWCSTSSSHESHSHESHSHSHGSYCCWCCSTSSSHESHSHESHSHVSSCCWCSSTSSSSSASPRIRSSCCHSSPIRCRPTSSLIAVIVQALAHREHYVWVTTEDNFLVGLVSFAGIMSVLSNHLRLSPPPP